jgi:hypothetical protein
MTAVMSHPAASPARVPRGHSIRVRHKVTAAGGRVVREGAEVTVAAWPPGADLEGLPWHRARASWDGEQWTAVLPTAGWELGTWLLRAWADGGEDGCGGAWHAVEVVLDAPP